MNFKFILLIYNILISFVICLPPFLEKNHLALSDLFLSKNTTFNYDEIKNLVVFGDSHSFLNNQWPKKLSDIHNHMKLWNFAKTGAVVNLNITYRGPNHGSNDLIKEYKAFYNMMITQRNINQWNGRNTLFAIHIGSNDIKDIYINKTEYTAKTINDWIEYVNNDKSPIENIRDVINIIFDKIKNIYINGGRNFLIFKLPPFELTNVNEKRKKNYKTGIPIFNSLLYEKSKNLYEEYKDINIIIYNLNEEYRIIINNFKYYNFVSGTEIFISCKNKTKEYSNNYFWKDHTHLTEKGNSIIAKDIDDLLKSINT